MKKIFTVLLFLILSASGELLAISWSPRSFCESIQNQSFVAKGKIVSYQDRSIKIKLLQTLLGEESADTIVVWDEMDITYMNIVVPMAAKQMGEIGDTIFFTADKIKEKRNEWDEINDYRFLNPFEKNSSLNVRSDTVYGFISGLDLAPPNYQVMKLHQADFLKKFQDCRENGIIVITSTKNAEAVSGLNLFPNPTENLLNIDFTSSQHVYHSVVIKNQLGQQVKSIDISQFANMVQIDVFDIAPGVVFVEFIGEGYTDRRKILKTQ